MKKPIKNLKIPAHHQKIYNDYGDEDIANLAEHMDEAGQITPIVITKSNTVISGARRVAAAKLLGWNSIDAVVKDIPKNQELYYIISANKQRSKTAPQLCEEIDELWKYYSSKKTNGRPKKGAKRDQGLGVATRDLVAADLGVSNRFIQQIRYIKSKHPDILPYLFVNITLTAAYAQIKTFENQKEVLKEKRKNGRHMPLDGVNFQLYTKSAVDMSDELDDDSVDHIVTSPPYYSQRIFQNNGDDSAKELGQEDDVSEYVSNLVDIIAECKRLLKPTGSMYLNLGDTYKNGSKLQVPERVSIAIQDGLGLYLRNTLIFAKGNSMTPESTKNRRHSDYEFIYHFTLHPSDYFYDVDAIRIPYATDNPTDRKPPRHYNQDWDRGIYRAGGKGSPYNKPIDRGANPRWILQAAGEKMEEPISFSNLSSSVRHPIGRVPGCILEISRHTQPVNIEGFVEHTAPFTTKLVREVLLPVARPGDVIYDPHSGSGTVGVVALEMGCNYIGVDINENFNQLAAARLNKIGE